MFCHTMSPSVAYCYKRHLLEYYTGVQILGVYTSYSMIHIKSGQTLFSLLDTGCILFGSAVGMLCKRNPVHMFSHLNVLLLIPPEL